MENINTAEYWDRIWNKEGLHTWRKYPATRDRIRSIIGINNSVIEFGCGVGLILKDLKAQENSVYGVDISEKAIKICHDQGLAGSVQKFPGRVDQILGYKFDYVVASHLIEHFNDAEIDPLLNEMHRIADKAIIIVPNNVLGHDECKEHYQKFTEQSLNDLLKNYWSKISIKTYIDQFDMIRIPCIISLCERME